MPFIPAAPTVDIIEKEALPSMQFAHDDVLTDPHRPPAPPCRCRPRPFTLGNAYHGKLDIYFQTADGATKRMATTIWAADADHLTLKSGTSLPLRAVLGFDFY